MTHARLALLVLVSLAFVACGEDATTPVESGGDSSPYLLRADVVDALPVIEALGSEAGTSVAVVGRVQELNRDGYAVFYVVDDSIEFCGRGMDSCGCKTPWDYCCEEERMRAARMPVELRGPDGMPARGRPLGLRLLDLVAVKGVLEQTAEGGLVLVASDGWYRRERPKLPDGLDWP